MERLGVYETSVDTIFERPIFDADKLGIETTYFPIVGVKNSVVLHGPVSVGRCLLEGGTVNGIVVTFNIVRSRTCSDQTKAVILMFKI